MEYDIPKGRMNKCEYVMAQLKERIITGAYKPGDRLPSEPVLCEQFDVSRITVREALKMLNMAGLVDIRQGKGTYVKPVDLTFFMQPLYQLMNFEEVDIKAIYDAREFIEGGTAFLAAQERTEEDLVLLKSLLEKIHTSLMDEDIMALNEYDRQFHRKIAEASHNPILLACYQAVDEIDRVCKKRFSKYLTVLEHCYCEHRAIYEAIRDGDCANARDAIVSHTRNARQVLL